MSDNGIKNVLEKLWMSDTVDSRLILAYTSTGNAFQHMMDEALKLAQSMDELKLVADKFDKQELSDLSNLMSFEMVSSTQPSIDTQITNLKSQLKHCKNPLQKLNLEREMNRLIREKGMRENYGQRKIID